MDRLTADIDAPLWRGITPVLLRDTTTAAIPKQNTELRVAWETTELRVLFQCADTQPWATLVQRDAPLYNEEVVEVFIDPVGDLESYFEIEVNPLNTVLDLVLRKNRSGYIKDSVWDCDGLRTEVRRSSSGWSAELSIPFRALTSEAPHPGTRWRANFYRIDRPPGAEWELSAWSPTREPRFHIPARFGVLEFAAETSPL
jgi:hypothetical protein